MKKNLVIIRFGTNLPLPKEVKLIIGELVSPEDQELALGQPLFEYGVVSIIRTRFSPEEVARRFEDIAAETGDHLPVVVLDLDSDGVALRLGDSPGFREMVRTFQEKWNEQLDSSKQTIQLSLDDLLDLVNRKGGVDALSTEERELLEKLSKNS